MNEDRELENFEPEPKLVSQKQNDEAFAYSESVYRKESEPTPEPEPAPEPAPQKMMEPEPKPVEKKDGFKRAMALVVAASVFGGTSIGMGIGFMNNAVKYFVAPPQQAEATQTKVEPEKVAAFNNQAPSVQTLAPSRALAGTFSDLISKVEPSVVNISSVMSGSQDIFNLPETPKGSGIIFKEDNEKVYVATNYHVINSAQEVNVSILDKEPVNAKLVGKEPQSDLAVISVLKSDLKAVGVDSVSVAQFGDSDKLLVGDIVIAIGNAMGEGKTATQGIISAKNKSIEVDDLKLTVIQTDAAINPGNSGGPLINMNGEVVGINTAKLMQQSIGTTAEGMGYSISANIAKPILDELCEGKPKAFLGIGGKDVTSEMVEMFNLPALGVLIEEVVPGSAAEDAGIVKTDIITGFNGDTIFKLDDLLTSIKKCKIGDEVEIKIMRGGKTPITLKVNLKSSETGSF